MSRTFDEVRVRGLLKLYGTTRALASIDAEFPAGAATIVEGHNGSGKSTLVQILAQLARPTKGRVHYGDLKKREARRHIGLVSHAPLVYSDLSARENLEFFAGLYDAPVKAVQDMIERFELEAIADRALKTYSRGQTQRVSLARALLAKPKLLLLDEPSTGLDESGTEGLAEVIDEEKARGAIIVVVTHSPAFAKRVGDRTLKLVRGRVS
ncbi:MAG: heme exporter protein A [Polyangiales bacterium]|jgi:heme exporter protein A